MSASDELSVCYFQSNSGFERLANHQCSSISTASQTFSPWLLPAWCKGSVYRSTGIHARQKCWNKCLHIQTYTHYQGKCRDKNLGRASSYSIFTHSHTHTCSVLRHADKRSFHEVMHCSQSSCDLKQIHPRIKKKKKNKNSVWNVKQEAIWSPCDRSGDTLAARQVWMERWATLRHEEVLEQTWYNPNSLDASDCATDLVHVRVYHRREKGLHLQLGSYVENNLQNIYSYIKDNLCASKSFFFFLSQQN